MNRIDKLFQEKSSKILSVYITAGYPELNDTCKIIKILSEAGTDMIEIGIPFSDPLADGPVIQNSSSTALKNGISLKLLFKQLNDIRNETDIPLLLMGYLNPVLQYGMEKFCIDCESTGIDGVILPDMPPEVFIKDYSKIFTKHKLHNIMLISPHTSNERIHMIDSYSSGFIYMVSASSTTGVKSGFNEEQLKYFSRIQNMKLKNPLLTGFGISNSELFKVACKYSHGAIVGSAFVKMINEKGLSHENIKEFISGLKN